MGDGGTQPGPGRDIQDIIATRLSGTPVPVDDDTAATAPADPAAATRIATDPAAATRVASQAPSRSDAPTVLGDSKPQTANAGGGTTGIRRTTSTFTRLGRTRTNAALPRDTQELDLRLQLSRPSVLSDMGRIEGATLPPGVAKLIDEHGTEGRYAVEKPLAQGGMGAVLLIKDGDFQRPAAMKVMLSRFAKSPEALERFLAEAQVTAQLEHPNIVPLHDMGIMDDGTVYFTMKFIQGESLGNVVKRLKSDDAATRDKARAEWGDERILLTFLKVLDGVGYAHHKGVVHRDLKPDNIMLGGHGEVLVVDWGIAKVLGRDEKGSTLDVVHLREGDALSQTREGSAMGTLYYMPPEQARGEVSAIDARSDVYALGATIYELLTLKRPVSGNTAPDIIARICSGELTPVKESRPDLTDDLAAIVMQAMACEPARRYQSCVDFADDLRRYLAGQAVAARQRNLIERVGAWLGRHKKKVAAAAAVAAILAISIVATRHLARQAEEAKADALVASAEALGGERKWAEARDAAVGALSLRPGDQRADAVRLRASEALAVAAQAREDAARAAADRNRAERLTTEARLAAAGRDWPTARDKAKAALEAAPSPEAQDILARSAAALADAQRHELETKAGKFKAEGDALLAQARATAPLAAERAKLLADAHAAYATSAADGIAISGVEGALAELGALQAKTDAAREAAAHAAAAAEAAAARRKQADESLSAGQALLATGELDAAAEAAAAARKLEPGDERATRLRDEVAARLRDREGERARAAAREQAHATAAQALARAREAEGRMRAAAAAAATAQATVTRLTGELAGQPITGKQALFTARDAAAAAAAQIAEQWALAEGNARTAFDALATVGESAATEAIAARDLLIALYRNRLAEARTRRALPEIAAFGNLLGRLGINDAATDTGTLAVAGPAGTTLAIHRLDEDGAGRLIAQLKAVATITLPAQGLALPGGRYELRGGDQVAAVVLGAAAEARLAWAPEAPPTVGSVRLRWVAPAAGGAGFWLAEDEVTIGEWAAFLADPAIFAKAKAAWRTREEKNGSIRLIPRRSPLDATWDPQVADEAQLELAKVLVRKDVPATSPVTGISRDDAEEFCRWLAAKSGRTVRLPRAAEWQRAATAGDDRRLHPWGPGFDYALATTALPRRDNPPPVGSTASDRGPYGHRDLAGSVREWLADVPLRADDLITAGIHGGRIAGGGFADAEPLYFRTTWTESVPPDTVNAVLGLRILVEP